MKLLTFMPALAVALAACARNPEPDSPLIPPSRSEAPAKESTPSVFDAIGNYEFTTNVDGQAVAGTIDIMKKDDGTIGARVSTEMTGEIPLTSVTVEGTKVSMIGNMPEGRLEFTMEFKNANEFTGSWTYAGMSGAFSGKRKA